MFDKVVDAIAHLTFQLGFLGQSVSVFASFLFAYLMLIIKCFQMLIALINTSPAWSEVNFSINRQYFPPGQKHFYKGYFLITSLNVSVLSVMSML